MLPNRSWTGLWTRLEDPPGASPAPDSRSHLALKLGLFVVWLSLILFMASHHTVWRDEVRSLSLALQGDHVLEMLTGLRGEGHPALWYLLLRGAHSLVRSPVVLPLLSLVIAATAALLLLLSSPFRWWMVALLLLTHFSLFEYSVMARNYGISALLLFLLAHHYPRHRDRSVLPGILLLLLANTNAHSVLLVGAFLLFWLLDLLAEQGLRWTSALGAFLLNAALATVGIAASIVTIHPTYNDAALEGNLPQIPLIEAVLVPGTVFTELAPRLPWDALSPDSLWTHLLISLLMFGSLLGLVRSPGAFSAGLTALLALLLFFLKVYPAGYRHQALWLVFLVSLYWITGARHAETGLRDPTRPRSLRGPASSIGAALMLVLVALQVPNGVSEIARVAFDRTPLSRARDLAAFVAARSDLQDAIIIADPDFLVETLPYYLPNPTYLMRERRFGNVSRFTRNARLSLDLDDLLATARSLRAERGKPVLILLHEALDPSQPRTYQSGYNWLLRTTPEQVRDFLASTRFLARFAPAHTDESFDLYLLYS